MRAEQVEEGRSPRPICLVSGRCGAVGALGRRRLLLAVAASRRSSRATEATDVSETRDVEVRNRGTRGRTVDHRP